MKIVDFTIEVNGVYVDVDLDQNVSFALNYSASDLENPTTNLVTYSDQISIPRTPHNDDIFGQIWDVRSRFNKFNPNKKANFRLHINNNIFQIGYIKIEEIAEDYKIRLYGSLGNLFSYLANIPLSELNVGSGYEHNINRSALEATAENYGYALTYQGEYENFDNSQVDDGTGIVDVIWEKSLNNQFATNGLNENERQRFNPNFSGEYRSYYQKPVVKLSPILHAIVEKANDEGYTLDISDDFFTSANPYYNDTWILSNIKSPGDIDGGVSYSVSEFGDTQQLGNVYITNNEAVTVGGSIISEQFYHGSQTTNLLPFLSNTITVAPGQSISANANLQIIATFRAGSGNQRQHLGKRHPLYISMELVDPNTGTTISDVDSTRNASPNTAVQNAAYNQSTLRAKRASTVKDNYFGLVNFGYDSTDKSDTVPYDGTVWKQKILEYTNRTGSPVDVVVALRITGNTFWDRQNQDGSNHKSTRTMGIAFKLLEGSSIQFKGGSESDDTGRTNSPRSYPDLINNEVTCADFLFSYTKLFGLMYRVNPATGNIEIKQRTNFYDNEVLDWTNIVDRASEYIIEPTQLSFRKGVFKYNSLDTKYEVNYRANTADSTEEDGREYGSYIANTGYELGSEEYNYLEGTVFDNVIIASDSNRYFQGRGNGFTDNKQLPHLEDDSGSKVDINGLVLLFKGNDQTPSRPVIFTDDTANMESAGTICWNDSNNNSRSVTSFPGFYRTTTFNGEVYSLNFAQVRRSYSKSEDLLANNPNSAIVPRYWKSYLSDKLNDQSKILTCYVALRPTDITGDILSKFIYLDQSLWVIQKIESFNPVSAQPTRVTLVKVLDKNNYLTYTNVTDTFIIRYRGNVIYDNSTGDNPQTISVAEGVTSVVLSVESSLAWAAISGLTVTPNSGAAGTRSVTVSLPTGTNTGSVTFNYGSNSVTVNIARSIQRTVTANTVNGIAAYINGLPSPQTVNAGRVVTFSSTGTGLFLYWIINGEQVNSANPSVPINDDTIATAHYTADGTVAVYCEDPNTTVTGVTKTGNYFILNEGQTYTFNNSDPNFSGFLFSGDTSYTGIGPHTITADDTVLQVFYNQVLINATINNLSPVKSFVGDYIFLEGNNSLDFDLEPNESIQTTYSTIPGDSFTFEKAPYHYPTFSVTDFPSAGIYPVTINGNRAGWDGDLEETVPPRYQQITRTVYGPVAYNLTSNLIINPSSGTGATNVGITLQGNGGTVTQTFPNGFTYTITLSQEVSEASIGWTSTYLASISIDVAATDTTASEVFYFDGYPYTLGAGLTASNVGPISFTATATFTANTSFESRQLVFTIQCNGQAYTMYVTQAGTGLPTNEALTVNNNGGAAGQTIIYDGTAPRTVTIPTRLANPNALSWSGASTDSYDGSAAKSFVIPTSLPNPNALTINNNGGISGSNTSYNGSGAVTLNVPTTLPNPQLLKFTGAASTSYNGASEVTVNIPSSSSGPFGLYAFGVVTQGVNPAITVLYNPLSMTFGVSNVSQGIQVTYSYPATLYPILQSNPNSQVVAYLSNVGFQNFVFSSIGWNGGTTNIGSGGGYFALYYY